MINHFLWTSSYDAIQRDPNIKMEKSGIKNKEIRFHAIERDAGPKMQAGIGSERGRREGVEKGVPCQGLFTPRRCVAPTVRSSERLENWGTVIETASLH